MNEHTIFLALGTRQKGIKPVGRKERRSREGCVWRGAGYRFYAD